MNIDLELLKAEIKIAEREILETKSQEFIDGYDTCKEMVDKFVTAYRKVELDQEGGDDKR